MKDLTSEIEISQKYRDTKNKKSGNNRSNAVFITHIFRNFESTKESSLFLKAPLINLTQFEPMFDES